MTTEKRKCDGALERSHIQQKPDPHLLVDAQHVQGHRLPFFPEPYYHILENTQHCLDCEAQTLTEYQIQIENVETATAQLHHRHR